MAYIGTPAVDRFVASKTATQFSGNGSAVDFTLDHSVGSPEDILVSVDGVVQEPTVAYGIVSGTTLRFTAAPSSNSGNNIFVYYLFKTVGTIDHPATSALSATNGTFSGNTTVAGTSTFTGDVTIGDASAADKKILFDGNAVDYHIGLDDSSDSLIIGKGSALGTTTSMAIDANGIITKPLQPAFSVHKSGNQNNFAINSSVLVTWASERFDVNSDFDLTNNQFVAPVTGKYFLNASIRLGQFDTSADYYNVAVVTSNEAYRYIIDPGGFSGDLTFYSMNPAVVADMDAGDTANITIFQSGGAAITDMDGSSDYTYFTGHLLA